MSEEEICHLCQSKFSEHTTPGEMCYICSRCGELVCTACSENDPIDGNQVICDECWTDDDDKERDNNQ